MTYYNIEQFSTKDIIIKQYSQREIELGRITNKITTYVLHKPTGLLYKMDIDYDKGGINYFNGDDEKRGYRASLVRIKDNTFKLPDEPYDSYSFTLGDRLCFRVFLLEVTRQSKKKLEEGHSQKNIELIFNRLNFVIGSYF